MKKFSPYPLAALTVAARLSVPAVWAQSAPVAEPASDTGAQLQEVVVTAEKAPELAQKTPISLEVYSSNDILAKGITDLESLAYSDPSLNFNMNAGEPYLTMRGISSSDTTEIGDPAVPVAQDGFFVNRSYALLTSQYDLERIEVLRGPQGTLYGRNAIGGVINMITAKPSNEFETSASVEVGNFNTLNVTGMMNLPVSDAVQMRIAFESRNRDGYRTVYPGDGLAPQRGDDEDVHSGRIELALHPVAHLHGLLTVEASRVGGVGEVVKEIPFIPSTSIPGDILHTRVTLGDTNQWDTYDPTSLSIDDKTYKWNFVYDGLPGGAAITYDGGYDNLQFHHITPSPGILGGPPAAPVYISYNEYPKTQNQELRVNSAPDAWMNWVVGGFFFEERNTNLDTYVLQDAGSPDAAQAIAFPFPLVESTSHALFGQGSIKLGQSVTFTAGARYTEDTKERTGVEELPVFGISSVPDGGSGRWSKTTGHVGVDVAVTPHSFEYAKIDTGYKAGGFASCNTYQPETVTTYEVGSKNRFMGNTAQLNVAAYYSAYKDQQVSMNVPTSTCVGGSTEANAGRSTIYGVETDANAPLGPIGRLDLSVNYLHARYTSFIVAPGLPASVADCRVSDALGNCQLGGNTLPQSPTWSVVAGLEHQWHLPSSMMATARIEGKYESLQYFDPFNYGSTSSPGFTVVDASFGIVRDRWSLDLWGRNLTNRLYLVEAQEQYGFNSYEYGFGAPRTFGLRVSVWME